MRLRIKKSDERLSADVAVLLALIVTWLRYSRKTHVAVKIGLRDLPIGHLQHLRGKDTGSIHATSRPKERRVAKTNEASGKRGPAARPRSLF